MQGEAFLTVIGNVQLYYIEKNKINMKRIKSSKNRVKYEQKKHKITRKEIKRKIRGKGVQLKDWESK